MTTSGTAAFSLDVDEALQEAIDRVGGEMTAGYDIRAARRSMNIMFRDWENRGIRLWTLEEVSQALTQGTASYTLGADTIDILDAYLRRDSQDTVLERLGRSRYSQISDKSQQGRPSQFYLDRQRGAPVLYLYHTPENSTDTVRYWRMRRIEDVTGQGETFDMPSRFFPPLVSGLAYYMSNKDGMKAVPQRREELRAEYERDIKRAMDADRERTSLFIRPAVR